MKPRRSLLLVLALAALVGAVWLAILFATPPKPTLDQRVYNVAAQLECPVCQNESVADSSASVAQQMRQVIRQDVLKGMSDQQILHYFAAHYGNSILLTPPQQGFNLLAWLMPVGIFLLGLGIVSYVLRDWRVQGRLQLATPDEQVSDETLADPELEQYRAQLERELKEDASPFS